MVVCAKLAGARRPLCCFDLDLGGQQGFGHGTIVALYNRFVFCRLGDLLVRPTGRCGKLSELGAGNWQIVVWT